MRYFVKTVASPVGALKTGCDRQRARCDPSENDNPKRVRLGELIVNGEHPVLCRAERELHEYFAGERTTFGVPLDPVGTDFQGKVWAALQTIPYGETRSYGALARQIGKPKAARAVGAANGRNPLSIVTPCHRAIGSNGAMTDFAGGIETKRYLLSLEAKGREPVA